MIKITNVLLYFTFKYKGDWEKIFKAIEDKENIDFLNLNKFLLRKKCKYQTIISPKYPIELTRIYKPPFVLFIDGNENLLEITNKYTIIGSKINEKNLLDIKKNFRDDVFILDLVSKEIIEKFIQNNIKFICVSNSNLDNIDYELKKKIIDNKNLIISEKPCKQKFKMDEVYFKRLLIGMGNEIVFLDDKIDYNEYYFLANYEKIKIYCLCNKEQNYSIFPLNYIRNFNEIKRIYKKH